MIISFNFLARPLLLKEPACSLPAVSFCRTYHRGISPQHQTEFQLITRTSLSVCLLPVSGHSQHTQGCSMLLRIITSCGNSRPVLPSIHRAPRITEGSLRTHLYIQRNPVSTGGNLFDMMLLAIGGKLSTVPVTSLNA